MEERWIFKGEIVLFDGLGGCFGNPGMVDHDIIHENSQTSGEELDPQYRTKNAGQRENSSQHGSGNLRSRVSLKSLPRL